MANSGEINAAVNAISEMFPLSYLSLSRALQFKTNVNILEKVNYIAYPAEYFQHFPFLFKMAKS